MDRDSIAELFFSGKKDPKKAANNVLLRLLRDRQIQRSTAFVPYLYFGPDVEMKKNSAKIGHFLAILEVYKELKRIGGLNTFMVEPKYGKKGCVEPDIYCQHWKKSFFVEVQRKVYSQKEMGDKLDRYVDLFNSGVLAAPFPYILILTDQRYAIDEKEYPFKIYQAESFTQFVNSLKADQPGIRRITKNEVKSKIGG